MEPVENSGPPEQSQPQSLLIPAGALVAKSWLPTMIVKNFGPIEISSMCHFNHFYSLLVRIMHQNRQVC